MTPWLEYHEQPVTLHSGARSHWLVRGDLIFADERLREAVLDYWVQQLRIWAPPEIIGIPHGGTPWARALRERYSFGRSTSTIVAVDDVVTTGRSFMDVGGYTDVRLAVFDRRVGERQSLPVRAFFVAPLPLLDMEPARGSRG